MSTTPHRHKLAQTLGKGDSPAIHKILELAMSEEDARFLCELPAKPADLAQKCGLTEAAVEEKLLNLAQRGLLTPSPEGMRFPPYWFTLHDTILSSKREYIPVGMERWWRVVYEGEGGVHELGKMYAGMRSVMIRTIPAPNTVPEGKLLPYEDIRQIIAAHKDLITIRDCCCRVGAQKCDHPTQVCMQFQERAEFDLYRKTGKQVSAEEALAIAIEAANSGLVPTVPNQSDMQKLDFICFCCGCCCLVIEPGTRAGVLDKILNPSRFVAAVRACDGCGDCVDKCAVNAITVPVGSGVAVIDRAKCLGCGACVPACPLDPPITMELVRPVEFIPQENISVTGFMHATE
jgi:ferredoxin